jgi:CPA2 family monovalent cation:H+ antiporter-2
LGAFAFHSFGGTWSQGVVFGLALSVASTVVLVRVLTDAAELHTPTGRIAVGWLVVEDIFTVFVLVLLPVFFRSGGAGLPMALLVAAANLAIFIAFTLVAGSRAIPWLLNKVADTHSRELFTLSVLALALGIAVASAHFFQVSMALGAFLAGMVVGQSEFSARAASDALPLRDAFAVMFFLSVGMLFDPRQAVESPWLIAITLGIVMIGKPLAAVVIIATLGFSSRIALGVALALAQIGEFSFLLATLGRQVGALPARAINPVVAAAILSIMLSPLLYRCAGPLERLLVRFPRLWNAFNRRASAESPSPAEPASSHGFSHEPDHRAVIVGFGHTGHLVAQVLRRRGIEPTVIEMNLETHRRLRAQGHASVYGDANRREVLEQAGVGRASTLILTASGPAATEAIRVARELNPGIHVVARADYLRGADLLRQAGASEVFSGEGEVAHAIVESLGKLGPL